MGLALVPFLPRRWIVGLARGVGECAYALAPRLRRIGMANLDAVYGTGLDASAKRAILKQSFRTFSLLLLDTFWFTRDTPRRIARWVEFGDDARRIFRAEHQVCVTGHFGNWEVLGQAVALRGFPLLSVATPLSNPAIDALFNRMRKATGQVVVPKRGAVRRMLAFLRGGGKIAILLDQNTRMEDGGVFMDFFGLPALVSPAAGAMACRTGSQIVFGFCFPEPDGRYRAVFPSTLDSARRDGESLSQTISRLNRDILAVIETQIREHPGLWLWMYKRWKRRAPDTPRERYPFYVRELPQAPVPTFHGSGAGEGAGSRSGVSSDRGVLRSDDGRIG